MAEKTEAELAAEKRANEAEERAKTAAAEVEKWKALSRKNEERATSNAEKAQKFDELEASSKTELERERERANKAETALKERDAKDEEAKKEADAKAALDKERADVATAKGIPAELLHGTSKAEFESHADALIKAGIKPAEAPPADGQGENGEQVSKGDEKSADEIVNSILGK